MIERETHKLTLRTDATSESVCWAGNVSHAQSAIRERIRGEEMSETHVAPVGVGEVSQ